MKRQKYGHMVALLPEIEKMLEPGMSHRKIMVELQERYEALVGQMVEPSRMAIDLYITARETMNRRRLEFA